MIARSISCRMRSRSVLLASCASACARARLASTRAADSAVISATPDGTGATVRPWPISTAARASSHLDRGDLAAFHQQCLRALQARDEWRTISLFDPEGRRLLITSEPVGSALPGPPAALAEGFRRLVQSRMPEVSDLFQSPVSGRYGVGVGVPILRDGEVRWVLSAGMNPEAVARLVTSQRVPADWSAALIDRRHRIVARSGGSARRRPAGTRDP